VTLAVDAVSCVLAVLVALSFYKAGVLRERGRWVKFARSTSLDCDEDGEFHDRVMSAATAVDTRGWQ
jgi:hypothetical protein